MNLKVGKLIQSTIYAGVLSSSLAGQVKAFPAKMVSQVMPPEVNKLDVIEVTSNNFTAVLKKSAEDCLNKGYNTFAINSLNGNFVSINPVDSREGIKLGYAVQSSSQTKELNSSTQDKAVSDFVDTLETNRIALGVGAIIHSQEKQTQAIVKLQGECSP